VVRAHSGNIRAESELNHGSTFYFTLPRQPAPVAV
jgi:signal transduction histidine kinase